MKIILEKVQSVAYTLSSVKDRRTREQISRTKQYESVGNVPDIFKTTLHNGSSCGAQSIISAMEESISLIDIFLNPFKVSFQQQ